MQMAMQHMGLQDLTASLQGQPSHRPPQPGSTDSRIDLCYADPAHVEVKRALYHELPSKITGHRPLEVQIRVLEVPPASKEDVDHDEQPPIRPPEEHDAHKWTAYYRTVQRILRQQDETDLNLAMRKAATACGLPEDTGTHRTMPPRIRTCNPWSPPYGATNGHYIQRYTPMTQRPSTTPRTLPHDWTRRRQLREWHVCRAKEPAQEQQRYFQNPKP